MPLPANEYFAAIKYTPHPKQWLFHDSTARFRLPCCGRRFGKSKMAGADLGRKMFDPKKRFWIVGPTYDLGEKEFRALWDDLIIGRRFGRDKRVKRSYSRRSGEMFIEMPWQTRVEVRSAQHPETLVGEGLDHVIMSEAAKHKKETWERFIRPAISDRRGSADFPTTPEGYNWFYQYWLYGQDEERTEFQSWRFPSWENTVMYPGGRQDPEILLMEATASSPEWFNQEIGADFSSFVGKIYPEWDDLTHIRRHTFNPNWKNYIAFDWGYVNPLAAVEFQIDGFDNVYIWREYYRSYQRLETVLMDLKTRDQPTGYRVDCCFGDAANPEAADYVSAHFCGCLAMPEAKQNWNDGIDCVKGFLQLREVGELDEYGTPRLEPKLYVDPSCINTISEFNNYRAAEGTAGRNPREIAQGIDDHCLDALRYGLVHIYRLGAQHHLAELQLSDEGAAGMITAGALSSVDTTSDGGFFTLDQEF